MPESLLSPSSVLLYGRVVDGLDIGALPNPVSQAAPGGALGANAFLEAQLRAANATIARIYGFSTKATITISRNPHSSSCMAQAKKHSSQSHRCQGHGNEVHGGRLERLMEQISPALQPRAHRFPRT
jgi:hypothetical protein